MTAALAILVIPTLYVFLQWAALARMRNAWQTAAVLPALFMALALLLMVVGLLTHTDLAVAAIVLGLPVATLYLLVLWPLHIALARG